MTFVCAGEHPEVPPDDEVPDRALGGGGVAEVRDKAVLLVVQSGCRPGPPPAEPFLADNGLAHTVPDCESGKHPIANTLFAVEYADWSLACAQV